MKKILQILGSFIFIFLFQFNFLKSVIILVHGSPFEDKSWYQKETDFYKIIEQCAKAIGQEVVGFEWGRCSVSLDCSSIIFAGSTLSFNILSRISEGEKRIILVGLGLGQEVIKVASQYLNFKKENCEIACDSAEYEPINKRFNDLKVQRDSLLQLWRNKSDFFQRNFLIETVINLGIQKSTLDNFPNLNFRFVADTNVIGLFYNIYSDNILWQNFVGSEELMTIGNEDDRVFDVHLDEIKGLVKKRSKSFCSFFRKKQDYKEIYLKNLAELIFIISRDIHL